MNKIAKRLLTSFLAALQIAALQPVQSFAEVFQKEYNVPNSGSVTSYMGKTLYTGQVHSHTSLSDGEKLPGDAWEYVKENSTLDFFGVTDHDVCLDYRNGAMII